MKFSISRRLKIGKLIIYVSAFMFCIFLTYLKFNEKVISIQLSHVKKVSIDTKKTSYIAKSTLKSSKTTTKTDKPSLIAKSTLKSLETTTKTEKPSLIVKTTFKSLKTTIKYEKASSISESTLNSLKTTNQAEKHRNFTKPVHLSKTSFIKLEKLTSYTANPTKVSKSPNANTNHSKVIKKGANKTENPKVTSSPIMVTDGTYPDQARFYSFIKENKIKCPRPAVIKSEFETVPQIPEKDCSAPYVEVNDGGRLGNQICQYMTLWLFRKHFGARVHIRRRTFQILSKYFPYLSIPHEESDCFPVNATSTSEGHFIQIYKNFYKSLDYIKRNQMKDAPLISQRNFIRGYPCENDLITYYREDLRNEFQIDPLVVAEAKSHMNKTLSKYNLKREDIMLVSVHIRRTDYMNFTKVFNLVLPGPSYFQTAMNDFRKRYNNVTFAVFSDDIPWCKEHFDSQDIIYPGTGEIKNPIFDFALITICDHHIIGLGTYSFSSAFFGRGAISYVALGKTKFPKYDCNPFLTPILAT